MKNIGFLNMAALVAAGTVVALAMVLFPEGLVSNVAMVSLAVVALAVGFIFYVPTVLISSQGDSDAAQMASLGPAGLLSSLLLAFAVAGFVFALSGLPRLAWAADILAVATLVIGGLLLRAASATIASITAQRPGPSRHTVWQGQLQAHFSLARDAGQRSDLEKLAEKFRYAASDAPGGSPQDAQIDGLIGEVTQQVMAAAADTAAPAPVLKPQLLQLEALLSQREVFLRSGRHKA